MSNYSTRFIPSGRLRITELIEKIDTAISEAANAGHDVLNTDLNVPDFGKISENICLAAWTFGHDSWTTMTEDDHRFLDVALTAYKAEIAAYKESLTEDGGLFSY